MPRASSVAAPAGGFRSVHRNRLVTALLIVCRKVRRLQTSAAAQAACDDVARWLRAMPAAWPRRRTVKKD
jgi:hypothetical protein